MIFEWRRLTAKPIALRQAEGEKDSKRKIHVAVQGDISDAKATKPT